MTTIVTSSWFVRLPDAYARIGISRGTPRGQRGYRMYRALAPGPWFASVDEEEYLVLYGEILRRLDPHRVIVDLAELADGRIPALLCFERPPPDTRWCHRGLVSSWLAETIGLQVPEFGCERDGTGSHHPKLPAA